MEEMECVVHYEYKEANYSDLKPLSDNQCSRLLEAKRLRLSDENEEN